MKKTGLSAFISANLSSNDLIGELRPIFIAILFFLSFSSELSAQEFTAKAIGDYGNVSVMEVSGNYDAPKLDGSPEVTLPRQVIAREFFKTHKDEYDFLVIFTNFNFQMPEKEARAFYLGAKNDTQGLGLDLINNSSLYGSGGRLQGTVDMGDLAKLAADPLDPKFEETLGILSHELMHRWAAYVKFKDANGGLSGALLGHDGSHWSFLLDSGGSVMYGNQWQDNKNGTFTSTTPQREMKLYNPLELYLMGMLDRSKVPPMLLITNPGVDSTRLPEAGVTITGTAKYVTIDDIIAANGPRVPEAANSQKSFKTAFIYITTPGAFSADAVYRIENVRNGFVTRHSILTDGRSIVEVASTPREDAPVNPGVLPPSTIPRTLPPNINDGVAWLAAKQQGDGSWMDPDPGQTMERDTAEVVLALKSFSAAQAQHTLGLQWLKGRSSGNIDYLSRKIEALAGAGQDTTAPVRDLVSKKNNDGGWGSERVYASNAADTALALKALAVAGYADQTVLSKAIEYLKSSQKPDGGWTGNGESAIQATASVLAAFNAYSKSYPLSDSIARGAAWLVAKQNADGGFGNSPSTVYDTALAVLALRELNASTDTTNKGLEYLLAGQAGDGSWNASAYQTALAVNAVYKATVDPDLSIKPADITFIPEKITTLPSNVVINANIANLGREGVPQAKVVLYEGSVSDATRIAEQTLAFPGQSSTAVTFQTTVSDGNERRYYIVVDPDNLVKESSEANNTAAKVLYPEATYDFEILSSDVTVSPNPVDQFQDVKITAKIANKGTMNAYNAQVKYFIDEPGAPYEMATLTVDVPAGAAITKEVTWRANKAGVNLPLTVQADPFNNFAELSEANNKASAGLTVNAVKLTDPNLSISYKDIVLTPSPAKEGSSVTISALVKNEGFSTASNVVVNFYRGAPGPNGLLLGAKTIGSLAPNESATVSVDWTNIQESGEKLMYIQVDPDNQINEIRKDDNNAFATLNILSLPDLELSAHSISFAPSAPKDGEVVAITASVLNKGEQSATNVKITAYEGNTAIGAQTISQMAGNTAATAHFNYDTTGKTGLHQITITVDPDNAIVEKNENNNSASKSFGVQDANLWVSEQYFSPNGDGVKDSTQFFFRLQAPQTAHVVVLNGKGETVRTFSGPEFENTSGNTVTWDGLDDNGRVVADGRYLFKALNAANQELGSVSAVVDNNQSPLTDAIGTKFLQYNNLTRSLPNFQDWRWLPDDSGIVFTISKYSTDTEHPSGLYLMSPSGEDLVEAATSRADTTYPVHEYRFDLSADGRTIVYVRNRAQSVYHPVQNSQIWKYDLASGRNYLIADYSQSALWVSFTALSPDGNYVFFVLNSYGTGELWLMRTDGTDRKLIGPKPLWDFLDSTKVHWSPDSTSVAYSYQTYDAYYNRLWKVELSDTAGSRKELLKTGSPINSARWLDSRNIVAYLPWNAAVGVIDATGSGNHVMLPASYPGEFSFAPDRRLFAYIAKSGNKPYLNVSDASGNTTTLHQVNGDYAELRGIVWSPDGARIAVAEKYTTGWYYRSTHYSLIIIDRGTGSKKQIPLPDYSYSLKWLKDGVSIVCLIGSGLYVVNSATGSATLVASNVSYDYIISPDEFVSPREQALSYRVSGCYGSCLWSVRSLLNLSAGFGTKKEASSITIRGTAADLNFESYQLEYADAGTPALWTPVQPLSDQSVINDVLGVWTPPYEGRFLVKLTARDKAGNITTVQRAVAAGAPGSIADLSLSRKFFSPNGDGVNDTVELRYRALEPVHLEFSVSNERGAVVRTFFGDHASPETGSIIWDGLDASGNPVPEGKYVINALDYAFPVEVDVTAPDVHAQLRLTTVEGLVSSVADVNGYLFDKNLTKWVIEYGEGDNPQEWTALKYGADAIGLRDDQGNIAQPLQDTIIARFYAETIGLLGGKKVRVAAEDAAGNKRTVVTGFLEEKIFLHTWDGDVLANPFLTPYQTQPGIHVLGGFETIGRPLAKLFIQYRKGYDQWTDGPQAKETAPGVFSASWDTNVLGGSAFRVRIKAVDVLGREFHSNELMPKHRFELFSRPCDLLAINHSAEKLASIRFFVRKNGQVDWAEYASFDSAQGGEVPLGEFTPPLPVTQSGAGYTVRMVGTGITGTVYTAEAGLTPCAGVSLQIDYQQSGCGELSRKALLQAGRPVLGPVSGVVIKTLNYFILEPAGWRLLEQVDVATQGMKAVSVDTRSLPEGRYPVGAEIIYSVSGSETIFRTRTDDAKTPPLVIDRVLPTARITAPAAGATVCPVRRQAGGVETYLVRVEGESSDDRKVQKSVLFYGAGESPAEWKPGIEPLATGQGVLGMWPIPELPQASTTATSFKLEVTDEAGNKSCATVVFMVDAAVGIKNLKTDQKVFSPNRDGIFDSVTSSYEINEPATIEAKVFRAVKGPNGVPVADGGPLGTIMSGLQHKGGTGSFSWNGQIGAEAPLSDGSYAITVMATDSCGNRDQKTVFVDIDNTRPTVAVAYPKAGDALGNIIEVKGTADDPHFQSYTLEAGEGDGPAGWTLISAGTTPVQNGVLGAWNAYGLNSGVWTLKLTAIDTVGNEAVATSTVNLGARKNLIKDLGVAPKLFSPNNDGKLDSATIKYEITDACNVMIELVDANSVVRKTYSTTVGSSGNYTYVWDGRGDAGIVVPDGVYIVKLTATLSSNTSVTQTESITVVVDVTQPLVDIKQPLNNTYIAATDVAVSGTISDLNIANYTLSYSGATLDQANQSRTNYTFGTLSGLAEGDYTLTVKATDLGQNETNKTIAFTIDRTPPAVKLDAPKSGEYYGTVVTSATGTAGNQPSAVMNIAGSIVEKNLEVFNLRYGPGDAPTQWTDLVTGATVTAYPSPYTWKVGKNDGIPDGVYTLSLYAKDKAGLQAEAKVKVTVDNTPPAASITAPQEGGYVKSAVDVKGTAFDQNLDKYTLDISEGRCDGAFKWATIKTGTASVQDNVLGAWQALPPDGDYCLRLTALDKMGSSSESKVNVKVDTHPPAAPALSGKVDTKVNAQLDWTRNTEPNIAGYNLYRNGQKVNTALITDIKYLDQNLTEGVYTYTVKAQDLAGWESVASNAVKLKIDLTGPDASIRSPQDGLRVSGVIDIKGTAYSSDDFKQYRLFIGQEAVPSTWTLIRTSPVPISYGVLSPWDTLGLAEGQVYSIKIEAEDISGNITTHQISVTIDNTPPARPVIISAVASGPTATVTWNANAEPDLAGYLLYRNDQLANVSGIVLGDLKPYLLSNTSYGDKNLPDGTFKYYVAAMDKAGNISEPSDVREVTIDTHPPHTTIISPADKTVFEQKIMVKAESADLDIASVQFQYQSVQGTAWSNLGSPVTTMPYVTYLDAAGLGLAYGDYRLRAVATDKGQKADPTPGSISITYTDLTPPAAVFGLAAATNGNTVTLTWTANTEADLDGYNIYRTSGNARTKINATVVKQAAYQDGGLADGNYLYEVAAVDTHKNESKPSNQANAKVYAPVITQPYTPTAQSTIQLQGTSAAVNSNVEISIENVTGSVLRVAASADAAGMFAAGITLSPGENRITARATDGAGNVSRVSETVVVISNDPPAAPTGLTASVSDYTVRLSWNANSETDLAGYNLYRNGVKTNLPAAIITGTATASSTNPYYAAASLAFDGNSATYWQSGSSYYNPFTPVWWQAEFPAPELVSRVEIHWQNASTAGKDFEIQAWSGYAWVTLAKMTGNAVKDNVFELKPSYRTSRMRIYITDVNSSSSYKYAAISEIGVLRDNLIPGASSDELNLKDGKYDYTVTAVDYYGFESLPSNAVTAEVGDIIPPSAPLNLKAAVAGPDVVLTWSGNAEQDVAGYEIYRLTPEGWTKINSSLVSGTTFSELGRPNGTSTYRITAKDVAGNESLPSNEVSAAVSVALPQPPVILSVTPAPAGGALTVTWTYSGSPAGGYGLYRATTAGGPYVKVAPSLPGNTSYLDTGLTNGTSYFYVVAAVDALGNESAYSNEKAGLPSDSVLPSKPVILYPSKPGGSATTYTDSTDIRGLAETGSLVELFRNGVSAGAVAAVKKDVIQKTAIGSVYDPAVSPDGKTLAYRYNNALWLRNIISTQTTSAVSGGYRPVWSADGSKIAYEYYDLKGYSRLGVYELSSGTAVPLTSDGNVYENKPSLSADGNKIAYISSKGGSYNIWLKDLTSGSLTQITNGISVYNSRLSPDGLKVAYFGYSNSTYSWNLHIYDSATGASTLADAYPNTWYLDWSPDGKKIAFVSSRAGNNEVFAYDTTDGALVQLTHSTEYEADPHWSPDGNRMAYVKAGSLWVAAYPSGETRQVLSGYFNYLTWLKSGEISYLYGNELFFVNLDAGYFEFKNVLLSPGENAFYAVATDGSGNKSEQSDPISVIYDTSRTPDLTVASDDVYLYPPMPLAGEQVAVNVVVSNAGRIDISNVDVTVYLWNALGQLELLTSDTIPSIPAGSSALIAATWNSTGKAGDNRLVVVVDPEDTIAELDESNNLAIKDFYVADKAGVALSTSPDSAAYGSSQPVNIGVTLHNSGPANNVVVETRIADANGYPVIAFDPKAVSLAYASTRSLNFSWNTGSTYAGPYAVHAVLKDASGALLAENTAPFTIVPDAVDELTVITDKIAYGPLENVITGFTIKNAGKNYIIPVLQAKASIIDASGTVLFSEIKTVSDLLPGASVDLSSLWNAGLTMPGDYHAAVEASFDGGATVTKSAAFKINALVVLTGAVTALPSVVPVGNAAQVTYTLANTGNADALGYTARISILDPETQTVMQTHDELVDIAKNSSRSGQVTFITNGYGLKTYTAVLQVASQGTTKNIASASFTVKDLTPPMVTIVSPAANGTYNSSITISALATDNASGVDRVEYQFDNGQWKLLAAAEPAQGRYATIWEPTLSDNGPHTIDFRATDKAGNTSGPVSISFIIQMDNAAPMTTIAVGTPKYEANGAVFVSGGTVFTLSATDDFSGVAKTEYSVDNGAFKASVGPFALGLYSDGAHTVTYRSTDNAGNIEADKTLGVVLDKTPPVTAVSATDPLTPGGVTAVSPKTLFGLAATDNLSGVGTIRYSIDGGEWQTFLNAFSLAGLPAGRHTIAYKATDNVQNEEAAKIVTVRLIAIDVTKKIDATPLVLVGIGRGCEHEDHSENDDGDEGTDSRKSGIFRDDGSHDDGQGKDRCRLTKTRITDMLTTAGFTFTLAKDDDDFTSSLRSGRYNTYLLVDYKDEDLGEEIREAVHSGDGLLFIKTLPDADPSLGDVFGVKFNGKTTDRDLDVNLTESPISNEGAIRSAGKTVAATITANTAQSFGYVKDRQHARPAVVFNQYNQGRVILYTFDLLSCPDSVQAAALLISSLNHVRPLEQHALALGSVPVRIRLGNAAEPVDIKLIETFPDKTTVDAITPQAAQTGNAITWLKSLSPNEKTAFGYYLNLPDAAGSYKTDTEIRYGSGGDYRLYGEYSLVLTIQQDSTGLLHDILSELNGATSKNKSDAKSVSEAIDKLLSVDSRSATLKGAERNIRLILGAIEELRGLSVDMSPARLKLDELLKIWEKKWFLAQGAGRKEDD